MRHFAVAVAALLALTAAAPCEAPPAAAAGPLSAHFRDEPPDALIRRLEAGPAAAEAAAGLVVSRTRRWAGDLGVLLIDTTVTNKHKAAASLKSVRLADWTFRIADGPDALRYRPLTYRKDNWYGSTYWTGPDWTRVGRDWHHPGINTPAVRRFTAPRAGRVTITGRVYKADTNKGGGDGVTVSVRHGARTVWSAEINGNDARGVAPKITLDVAKGDSIRFVVHKRGRIFHDTTRWDPAVTYAGGGRFLASKGFSTKHQGDGGWSYEMDAAGQKARALLPSLHSLSPRGLALVRRVLAGGQEISLADADALPLFVLADAKDRSGVAMAVSGFGARSLKLRAAMDRRGRLRITLDAVLGPPLGKTKARETVIQPGRTLELPRVALAAYRGRWTKGLASLQKLVNKEPPGGGVSNTIIQFNLGWQIGSSLGSAGEAPRLCPELELWAMVQADWWAGDKLDAAGKAYPAAIARHLKKASELLADLRKDQPGEFLAAEAKQLARFAAAAKNPPKGPDDIRALYLRVRWLKRRIALANPLMKFGRMLFAKRVPTSYSHLVMQYFGWRGRPGGGLFVLARPGWSLACRDVLGGRLAGGSILEPRLSYDAKRVVFSFVDCGTKGLDAGRILNDADVGFYHVHEADLAGGSLRQLTSGPYDDLMPAYLPDGGIVFSSTRRKGYARCFGGQFSRRWHVYALHRMAGDGRNIRAISFHDTNEWFPAVANSGHVLYSRWDYIDRDAVTHQNLWSTRPDGTNPLAVWGNATASPHCSFQAQPIPGSGKIVFTASAHHSITGGSIAIVDGDLARDGQQAVTRITPEVPFPEAEGRGIREYYAAPWPLSEKYFLVAYSPTPLIWEPHANRTNALGIYLLDSFGNRELLYRDADIGSTNPCPLRPRPRPPVLASAVAGGKPATGEMILYDVYDGLGKVPRGSIKALRIIQILPKTTHLANKPAIGLAGEENARAVLGTVPVEADGSAYFAVPARKPILFQAIDAGGFAHQTMRSVTYVQGGERVACVGCHERPGTAPGSGRVLALRRGPSRIAPGPFGGRPFSFVRVVQPVLDRHCVKCHSGTKPKKGIDLTSAAHKGFTRSYWSLCGDRNFSGRGTNPKNAAEALVPRFGARNQVQITPPGGMYGALGSRLIKMLRKGHNKVKLTPDELRRLALWIDCNAIFYGVYDPAEQAKQLRGQPVAMPEIQ